MKPIKFHPERIAEIVEKFKNTKKAMSNLSTFVRGKNFIALIPPFRTDGHWATGHSQEEIRLHTKEVKRFIRASRNRKLRAFRRVLFMTLISEKLLCNRALK